MPQTVTPRRWCGILGRNISPIDSLNHFLQLGGHSLVSSTTKFSTIQYDIWFCESYMKSAKNIFYQFRLVKLKDNIDVLKTKYGQFVFDTNDAHIVAGVKESSAQFLITYNLKHFKKISSSKILKQLPLPPPFLQYLRSRS